ncbi:MAG: hypothetical protein L0Y72_13430 [Gemmataceae bacterium]|nr:hypothetical protein [Gemmataceae bacterium]
MLQIPQLLDELIANGRWPRNAQEANAQNLEPLAAPERVNQLAPEETCLYFLPPPFLTVREKSAQHDYWNWPQFDPSGIDFDLALDIGDFGLGSDAPILLDYRLDRTNPRVLRLLYPRDGSPNRWVIMANDFPSFVEALGL